MNIIILGYYLHDNYGDDLFKEIATNIFLIKFGSGRF